MIQNKIEVYTYSERGIINSIIYELFYSNDYSKITAILDMIEPPMAIGKIINLKIFIEQSFSGFGDPDLIFLIKNEDHTIGHVIQEFGLKLLGDDAINSLITYRIPHPLENILEIFNGTT